MQRPPSPLLRCVAKLGSSRLVLLTCCAAVVLPLLSGCLLACRCGIADLPLFEFFVNCRRSLPRLTVTLFSLPYGACPVHLMWRCFSQSVCSSLELHDGAVYDLYAKLRNAPEMQQNNGLEDGTVIVVNSSRSPDGHLGSDRSDEGGHSGGVVGGEGGVASPPSALVTTPTAYATSE